MESLILYKKKSPYMTESSYTETIKVDVEQDVVDTIKGPVETKTIHVIEDDVPVDVTVTSQDSLISVYSGYSAYTETKTIRTYEDKTKNCKLTMEDLDKNFLTLKDHDISGGTFDESNHKMTLVRNNGETINIPVINPYEDLTGHTSIDDIELSGNVNSNGVLTLSYKAVDGIKFIQISGFTQSGSSSSETVNNLATETPNIDKTSSYKNVLAIVNTLPSNPTNGDRYVIQQTTSIFGRLYSKKAILAIQKELAKHNILWHIPTSSEWNELIEFVEPCTSETGDTGNTFAGLALKSDYYWNGRNKYDFEVVPTAVNDDETRQCDYWASTLTEALLNSEKYNLIEFTDNDNVAYEESNDEGYYSLRLMCTYDRDIAGISVNILGTDYKVIKIGNQYWLQSNFDYAVAGSKAIDYRTIDKKYSGTSENKLYIAYYENGMWEQKQLIEGDDVWVNTDDGMQEYYVAKDTNGQYVLMPLITMSRDEENNLTSRYDCGWY